MESTSVIVAEKLRKDFKTQSALKSLSFAVKAGEIFGFLGPSGAGKTTTIKILTGQLLPTSGQALILGKPVEQFKQELYPEIGIVTDNSGLYESLTVYENLAYFAQLFAVDKRRIQEVLGQVELLGEERKKVKQLSKGMKQRLRLARAILHKPQILFLDEPTSGLDPGTALGIHTLLLGLKEQGTTIFLTTHNMVEATKLCNQVALLNDGVLVEVGNPQMLCLKYQHEKKFRVRLENGTEQFITQTEADISQLTNWLQTQQIATCHSCEPTLEDVFLRVTGKSLHN